MVRINDRASRPRGGDAGAGGEPRRPAASGEPNRGRGLCLPGRGLTRVASVTPLKLYGDPTRECRATCRVSVDSARAPTRAASRLTGGLQAAAAQRPGRTGRPRQLGAGAPRPKAGRRPGHRGAGGGYPGPRGPMGSDAARPPEGASGSQIPGGSHAAVAAAGTGREGPHWAGSAPPKPPLSRVRRGGVGKAVSERRPGSRDRDRGFIMERAARRILAASRPACAGSGRRPGSPSPRFPEVHCPLARQWTPGVRDRDGEGSEAGVEGAHAVGRVATLPLLFAWYHRVLAIR